MFDRRDRYARDNIPQLERRIESNENKLQSLRSKPEGMVKPGEVEKVEESIIRVRSKLLSPILFAMTDALLLSRIKNPSYLSMPEASSSKSVSATSSSRSRAAFSRSARRIRTGRVRG
jgi:hypothetical protein